MQPGCCLEGDSPWGSQAIGYAQRVLPPPLGQLAHGATNAHPSGDHLLLALSLYAAIGTAANSVAAASYT